jgi:phosphocarrier protein HPr
MPPETDTTMEPRDECTRTLAIANRLGLHARAAAQLVQLAQQYQSEISLEKNGVTADAKSVLSLLTLECPAGTHIVVRAVGEDSSPAVQAVAELIANKFGEE